MKEQFVKLSDVAELLDNAGKVSDGEYSGYCTEDVHILDLPVYEFEVPDEKAEEKPTPRKEYKYPGCMCC